MKLLAGVYVLQPIAECVAALGLAGEITQAHQLLQRLEHPPSGIWLDPVPMGDAYAGLGDIARAIESYRRRVRRTVAKYDLSEEGTSG